MRRFVVAYILVILTTLAVHWPALCLAADELTGAQLFTRKWVAHDQRSGLGDGLGPMHNATSCVACHHQGGAGGGGGREHNVDLLSVVPSNNRDAGQRQKFIEQLNELHPGFADGNHGARPNLVLHRFGPEADYYELRAKVLQIDEPRPDTSPARRAITAVAMARRQAKLPTHHETLKHDGIVLMRTQRNTPALWGAGLIDAIPDAILERLAEEQALKPSAVSGRVPPASGEGIGRFGWRGQTASLREFVLAACANELGLQTPGHLQAANPLAVHYKGPADDLSGTDLDRLVNFIAKLPQPMQRDPRSPAEEQALRRGERAFQRAGCSDCHPRELGRVAGVFSDLLLHDLGPSLADPVEPNPETRQVAQQVTGYSGSGVIFVDEELRTPELAQEWRTPPLWGVADSAPYLHDGRAETLLEAILLHGGEAASSTKRFREMPGEERTAIIAFLQSLIAPQSR